MRIAPWLVMGLALAAVAAAQNVKRGFDFAEYKRQQEFKAKTFARANELRPGRRDAPIRYVNISDNEMREIQLVAAQYMPRALVNVSPVVTGCPCEEGPGCTDEVYILANGSKSTVGLQLVRIKNIWSVGAVQKWWLKRDSFQAKMMQMTDEQRDAALWELANEFPACLSQTLSEPTVAVNPVIEGKK
ncbi:MAG TPA: hypothetical protein VGO61_07335 [Steroidobacteraceae bacterium]|jgi:hypothetical protein|nr:hypothetical protein [Steroidobacteraceae bacterium]